MNWADGALVCWLLAGAVVGWHLGAARTVAFSVAMWVVLTLDFQPATLFSGWVVNAAEKLHATPMTAPNPDFAVVGEVCGRLGLALLAGLVMRWLVRRNEMHWIKALSFSPFVAFTGPVGAVDGALVAVLVGCELALLFVGTVPVAALRAQVHGSGMLYPAVNFFGLAGR